MIDFRFAQPLALLLFLPAVLLLVRWFRGQMRSAPAVLRYSDTRLLRGLPPGYRLRLRRLPDVLRLIAWCLLVIALARPQAGQASQIIRGQGIDIALALDISNSMSSPDFGQLTRLEAAKVVIADFVRNRDFDRIGLVVFAEDAFYRVPPTLDYRVLLDAVDEIQFVPDLELGNRTALGVGLATAVTMLRNSDAASKVIILLTDGANNAGSVDPVSAAEAAFSYGIRVYTIGMGASGMISTGPGDVRPSDLDEDSLRDIAAIGSGHYFSAVDLAELQAGYDQIDGLETSPIERQIRLRWADLAAGWLLAALILLLMEMILRRTIFQTIP